MFQYGLSLLLVVIVLGISGQHNAASDTNHVVNFGEGNERIAQLKSEMELLSQETDRLNAEKQQLTQNIQNLKESCNMEVTELTQSHDGMMVQAEENKKILVDLLKKIQDEEAEHIRLEEELKKLSEALEMYEHQYEIVLGDLKLMERRRSNGTTTRCSEVTNAIAVEAAENLSARAHISSRFTRRIPKISQVQREIITLESKLRIAKIMKEKVEGIVRTSQREYENEDQLCKDKKTNINNLIEETKIALETSEHSIKLLDNDLKASIAFSEAVRLEIQTGKNFLLTLREKIEGMKNAMRNYSEDSMCFNKIKSMD
ncbi:hypothetical protein J6590_056843 [Homalodisca vitripennis]|nr:hypothetical protein J6590_056843 [Homalodisca vitripennis]